MAVLILLLFPILYLFQPRLAFGALIVGIVLLYQKSSRRSLTSTSATGMLAQLNWTSSQPTKRASFRDVVVETHAVHPFSMP